MRAGVTKAKAVSFSSSRGKLQGIDRCAPTASHTSKKRHRPVCFALLLLDEKVGGFVLGAKRFQVLPGRYLIKLDRAPLMGDEDETGRREGVMSVRSNSLEQQRRSICPVAQLEAAGTTYGLSNDLSDSLQPAAMPNFSVRVCKPSSLKTTRLGKDTWDLSASMQLAHMGCGWKKTGTQQGEVG
ncbi:unnamed protein product [Caenorhabditis auriculariae]|uniref:Uncharacterized protein n=1 Tax=Caenorhabditis auriculariae TaxID=2777116 RepID=A0A8S1HGD6_9PELO|nr:unnamed protein product [Caenorhabditis auriculariae]